MLRKIAIFGVLCSLALVDASRIPVEIGSEEQSSRFPKVDEEFVPGNRSFSFQRIETTGQNPLLDMLCQNNVPGNYQYPYKCHNSKFIQCGYGGQVFLSDCPAGLIYNPIPDECVYNYPPRPGGDTCPWRSIWRNPGSIRCSTLGQRPWWGAVTFPRNPRQRCGRDIYFCHNYKEVPYIGRRQCAPGYGYSKAFFGCLEYRTCNIVDRYFDLA